MKSGIAALPGRPTLYRSVQPFGFSQMYVRSLSGLAMQVDKSDPYVYNVRINKF
jgi:hypothetical protein